jgi:hypothetical protein
MENVKKVVDNGVQAKQVIEQLTMQGFHKDDIYLFAHDKSRSENLTNYLEINNVGVEEQGIFESFANVFRSRGDELRSKFESLGLTTSEVEHYEEELDHGRCVIVATK